MAKEYRAKVFKSGNSNALRLPRELGFKDGEDMVIVPHGEGQFSLWKQGDQLNVLMSLYGSVSPGFMKDGRGDIDQDDREWTVKQAKSAA